MVIWDFLCNYQTTETAYEEVCTKTDSVGGALECPSILESSRFMERDYFPTSKQNRFLVAKTLLLLFLTYGSVKMGRDMYDVAQNRCHSILSSYSKILIAVFSWGRVGSLVTPAALSQQESSFYLSL